MRQCWQKNETPEYTSVCLLVDKEEIGSVGATGMQSRFFENTAAEADGSSMGSIFRTCTASCIAEFPMYYPLMSVRHLIRIIRLLWKRKMQHILEKELYLINIPVPEESQVLMMPVQNILAKLRAVMDDA